MYADRSAPFLISSTSTYFLLTVEYLSLNYNVKKKSAQFYFQKTKQGFYCIIPLHKIMMYIKE